MANFKYCTLQMFVHVTTDLLKETVRAEHENLGTELEERREQIAASPRLTRVMQTDPD